MKVHNVKSSAVKAIAYNRESRTLFVRFSSNAVYAYSVHPRIFTSLRKADSIGEFLNQKVLKKYAGFKLVDASIGG